MRELERSGKKQEEAATGSHHQNFSRDKAEKVLKTLAWLGRHIALKAKVTCSVTLAVQLVLDSHCCNLRIIKLDLQSHDLFLDSKGNSIGKLAWRNWLFYKTA